MLFIFYSTHLFSEVYRVGNKSIEIGNEGKTYILNPGSTFSINIRDGSNGWNWNIKIISGDISFREERSDGEGHFKKLEDAKEKNFYLGKKSFDNYVNNKVLTLVGGNDEDILGDFIEKNKIGHDQDIFREDCPSRGEYEIRYSLLNIDYKENKLPEMVPSGSIFESLYFDSKKKLCAIKLLSIPKRHGKKYQLFGEKIIYIDNESLFGRNIMRHAAGQSDFNTIASDERVNLASHDGIVRNKPDNKPKLKRDIKPKYKVKSEDENNQHIEFRKNVKDVLVRKRFEKNLEPQSGDCIRKEEKNKSSIGEFASIECGSKMISNSDKRTFPNDYLDEHYSKVMPKTEFSLYPQRNSLVMSQKKMMARCIQKSLQNGHGERFLINCEDDNKILRGSNKNRPKKDIRRPTPCASKDLATLLTNQYFKAMDCLDLPVKEMFPLINHESQFQPNTMSSTGAFSFGQIITSTYIGLKDDLTKARSFSIDRQKNYMQFKTREGYWRLENMTDRERLKYHSRQLAFIVSDLGDKLMDDKNTNCRELREMSRTTELFQLENDAKEKEKIYFDNEKDRVCGKDSLVEEFLLTGIEYLKNKKHSEYLLYNYNRSLEQENKMSEEQIGELSVILARWMHNMGLSETSKIFDYFIGELKSKKIVKRDRYMEAIKDENGNLKYLEKNLLKDFSIPEFKKYFSQHVKIKHSTDKLDRRAEVTTFIDKIDRDLEIVEGGELECGE